MRRHAGTSSRVHEGLMTDGRELPPATARAAPDRPYWIVSPREWTPVGPASLPWLRYADEDAPAWSPFPPAHSRRLALMQIASEQEPSTHRCRQGQLRRRAQGSQAISSSRVRWPGVGFWTNWAFPVAAYPRGVRMRITDYACQVVTAVSRKG